MVFTTHHRSYNLGVPKSPPLGSHCFLVPGYQQPKPQTACLQEALLPPPSTVFPFGKMLRLGPVICLPPQTRHTCPSVYLRSSRRAVSNYSREKQRRSLGPSHCQIHGGPLGAGCRKEAGRACILLLLCWFASKGLGP